MKTVMITGSSRGLGRELALEFSKNYKVILHGRNPNSMKIANLVSGDHESYIVDGDITDERTLQSLEDTANRVGLDILVNNVGIYSNGPTTPEELKKIMETNFLASANLTLRLLPIMMRNEQSLIVNINSLAGKQGGPGEPAYSASKHALKGFFDSLRYQVTKHGVRIMDVYLGAMRTQMTEGRPNWELAMYPEEVARVIIKNCDLYDSLSLTELNIGRRKYLNT
jgi:short-subunit dehydrogenase